MLTALKLIETREALSNVASINQPPHALMQYCDVYAKYNINRPILIGKINQSLVEEKVFPLFFIPTPKKLSITYFFGSGKLCKISCPKNPPMSFIEFVDRQIWSSENVKCYVRNCLCSHRLSISNPPPKLADRQTLILHA